MFWCRWALPSTLCLKGSQSGPELWAAAASGEVWPWPGPARLRGVPVGLLPQGPTRRGAASISPRVERINLANGVASYHPFRMLKNICQE